MKKLQFENLYAGMKLSNEAPKMLTVTGGQN
jgi:hypothetical protein